MQNSNLAGQTLTVAHTGVDSVLLDESFSQNVVVQTGRTAAARPFALTWLRPFDLEHYLC